MQINGKTLKILINQSSREFSRLTFFRYGSSYPCNKISSTETCKNGCCDDRATCVIVVNGFDEISTNFCK